MAWLLAILSGILAAFSYPTVFSGLMLPDLGFLAFFCWIPLFQVLTRATPRRAFTLGFVAGFVQYTVSMYWVYTAMNSFGNMSPFMSALALAILIMVLSFYFSLIFYLSQWVVHRTGMEWVWVRPLFWVALEYGRGHFPTGGHPWSQIAYSQGGFLSFIQVADLLGVYLVVYLLVFFNEVGSLLVRRFTVETPRRGVSTVWIAAALGIVFFAADLGYGYFRFSEKITDFGSIKVGVVQGNIPQDEKWQNEAGGKILQTFQEGTSQLEAQGARLILWPEASFPFGLYYDQSPVKAKLGNESADLLFGAITRQRSFAGPAAKRPVYNSALLLDSQGKILDYYHKRHLVPFGEYVPWKEWLFFVEQVTQEVGNLLPGEMYRPIRYGDILLGILICYEDIFPEVARIMVKDGAQALINITNDAWYGYSSAAFQHQVFSQFRSVETRRALIRATNTGLSSLIDRWGRVVWQGKMFEYQTFLDQLPLYQDRSLYVRIGDVFPIACLTAGGIMILAAMIKRKGSSHV